MRGQSPESPPAVAFRGDGRHGRDRNPHDAIRQLRRPGPFRFRVVEDGARPDPGPRRPRRDARRPLAFTRPGAGGRGRAFGARLVVVRVVAGPRFLGRRTLAGPSCPSPELAHRATGGVCRRRDARLRMAAVVPAWLRCSLRRCHGFRRVGCPRPASAFRRPVGSGPAEVAPRRIERHVGLERVEEGHDPGPAAVVPLVGGRFSGELGEVGRAEEIDQRPRPFGADQVRQRRVVGDLFRRPRAPRRAEPGDQPRSDRGGVGDPWVLVPFDKGPGRWAVRPAPARPPDRQDRQGRGQQRREPEPPGRPRLGPGLGARVWPRWDVSGPGRQWTRRRAGWPRKKRTSGLSGSSAVDASNPVTPTPAHQARKVARRATAARA